MAFELQIFSNLFRSDILKLLTCACCVVELSIINSKDLNRAITLHTITPAFVVPDSTLDFRVQIRYYHENINVMINLLYPDIMLPQRSMYYFELYLLTFVGAVKARQRAKLVYPHLRRYVKDLECGCVAGQDIDHVRQGYFGAGGPYSLVDVCLSSERALRARE